MFQNRLVYRARNRLRLADHVERDVGGRGKGRVVERVTSVACHPRQPVVAVGYADGAVKLVRIDDDALILARPADEQSVSALGWDSTGQILAFGTESGGAGILAL